MVHENVVRRSVNLETGQEELEVLGAGELTVERFSKRPARNRIVQSQRHYHGGRAGPSQHTTPAAAHETSSMPVAGTVATANPATLRSLTETHRGSLRIVENGR